MGGDDEMLGAGYKVNCEGLDQVISILIPFYHLITKPSRQYYIQISPHTVP